MYTYYVGALGETLDFCSQIWDARILYHIPGKHGMVGRYVARVFTAIPLMPPRVSVALERSSFRENPRNFLTYVARRLRDSGFRTNRGSRGEM